MATTDGRVGLPGLNDGGTAAAVPPTAPAAHSEDCGGKAVYCSTSVTWPLAA